ncbi:MAG: hypothetical protein IJO03_09825 [Clostridia bacterium]|nr:hypothetical protein [Clostridia bacterium]
MKKTMKSIIAATLALVMLLCSVPAFAYNTGDTVEWLVSRYEYMDSYLYAGELKVGNNTVTCEKNNICCNINVDKAGYYLFTGDEMGDVYISENIQPDGSPQGYIDVLEVYESEKNESVVYLPEGESFIGFYTNDSTDKTEITVSYFDEEITAVEFEENSFKDLIFWEDYWISPTDDGEKIGMYRDAKITFSNGSVYEVCFGKFAFDYEMISENEYNLTVILPGYTEEFIMTCCEVKDVVKNVEITNIDKYLNSVLFYDNTACSAFEDDALKNEKMTLTFVDGSTYTIDSVYDFVDYVDFPNGRGYEMFIFDVVEENGSVKLVVEIAEQSVAEFECKVRKASFFENLSVLADNITENLNLIKYEYDMFTCVLNAEDADVNEIVESIKNLIDIIKRESADVYEKVINFADFYINGGN